MEEINPFPYFTRFLEERLKGRISYRHFAWRNLNKRGFYGGFSEDSNSYEVIFHVNEYERILLGIIENIKTGSLDDCVHYYSRATDYKGKLPDAKGRLTKLDRRIRVIEHPENFRGDLPLVRKVKQPRFYNPKFSDNIFAYVQREEEEAKLKARS